ncbi:imelysin family protein [uncultured Polaribacter sp.]|uniref:imelysin family protein n=1 Tax=uncultured Polaribacter sp. TaxID=174711 RepID=UPI002634F915|nr:imelysin family protein [uncultured Polaribacter sp.]
MLKQIFYLFVFVVVVTSCGSSSENDSEVITDSFDRVAMLTNITDNIIIPSYEDFSTKMSALKQDGETFTATPNIQNMNTLRASWLNAYKSWQHIEMYNIGRAEEIQYSFFMNIYPLTVRDVENNIASGSYDLDSPNNHDAQGFPALDYLLHGLADSDEAILEKYTATENKDNYKAYLTDVLAQMDALTTEVVNDFISNKSAFVASVSNTATSSVNKLINDYIFYYEKNLRAAKIGIPAGIFSSNPLPEKVEGFYKQDISKTLALEALSGVKLFFEGTDTLPTFKQYLESLDRQDLATSITNQLVTAQTQINTLDDNFFNQVNTDNTAMTKAYDELQKVVVLIKVDMLQAFNVSVDFIDADGD